MTEAQADARVRFWAEEYPRASILPTSATPTGAARDTRSSFPGEQYRAPWLEALAGFTRRGIAEVEVHLHHWDDTVEMLRRDLLQTLPWTSSGRTATSRATPDGCKRYAFIHGNWCLANAREDGARCGVDDEIPLLFETGCYADFTFPAAPDQSQPNIVNQIYWPTGDLGRRRAYESGERARVGLFRRDRILMIEGPLSLGTRAEKIPVRIENSAITAKEPGTAKRVATWVKQNIHVAGRPEWVFVKVHTHGAPELQAASLLGEGGRTLHRALTSRYNDGRSWILHYVSAREMFNIAIAPAWRAKFATPSTTGTTSRRRRLRQLGGTPSPRHKLITAARSPGRSPSSPHPLELSTEVMRDMVDRSMERILAHLESLPCQPMHATAGGKKLARWLRAPMPERGAALREAAPSPLLAGSSRPASTPRPRVPRVHPRRRPLSTRPSPISSPTATNRYVGVWLAAPGLAQIEEERHLSGSAAMLGLAAPRPAASSPRAARWPTSSP